jgi:membrane protein involved in colicin uptake
VAQFGRGIMGDVSEKLMGQFANNLNSMLDAEADTPEEAAQASAEAVAHADDVAAQAAAETAAAEPAPAEQAPAEPAAEAPKVRRIEGPAAEPIELSDLAGSAVVKRLLPLFGGLLVLLLVLRRLRK